MHNDIELEEINRRLRELREIDVPLNDIDLDVVGAVHDLPATPTATALEPTPSRAQGKYTPKELCETGGTNAPQGAAL